MLRNKVITDRVKKKGTISKRSATIMAAVVFLSACASSGVQVTQEQMTGFQKGVTTEPEVIQKLGRPNFARTSSDGSRMLIYSYAQSQIRPATLIPVVGIFAGGADVKTTSATFIFSRDGKLSEYSSTQSEHGTGTGLSAGKPIQQTDQPRQSE